MTSVAYLAPQGHLSHFQEEAMKRYHESKGFPRIEQITILERGNPSGARRLCMVHIDGVICPLCTTFLWKFTSTNKETTPKPGRKCPNKQCNAMVDRVVFSIQHCDELKR